ncbi:MAG TPA: hypothetical protein VL485_17225 [Ktedonobacteraceae bacterium]|jgi:hypothetical protein|nr:hypothetical protein [Ktedonobacteraceae bacterium]
MLSNREVRQRLFAMHAAGVDEIVVVINSRNDPERTKRVVLEILASIEREETHIKVISSFFLAFVLPRCYHNDNIPA